LINIQTAFKNRDSIQPTIVFTWNSKDVVVPIDMDSSPLPVRPIPRYASTPFKPKQVVGVWLFEKDITQSKAMTFLYAAVEFDVDFHSLSFFDQRVTLQLVRSLHQASSIKRMRDLKRYDYLFNPFQSYNDAITEISSGELNLVVKRPADGIFLTCMICSKQIEKTKSSGWDRNATSSALTIKTSTRLIQNCEIQCIQRPSVGLYAILTDKFQDVWSCVDSMQVLYLNYQHHKKV
jgi:hypothetical protein